MFKHTSLLLVCCLGVANAALQTSLWKYDLSDSAANPAYPAGTIEYHCFDEEDGVKNYVRGTYANMGYFEGAVDDNNPNIFHVNWYETTFVNDVYVPTSGAAVLNYTDNFVKAGGPYWNTGSSDLLFSYSTWDSTAGEFVSFDTTTAESDDMREKCLYPGITRVAARADIAAIVETQAVSGSSEQGASTLCLMPAGVQGGSWLGSYQYVYGEDDGAGTEIGNYGTNPFAFWVNSGMGFAGSWFASTGGYAGNYGSNIYMVTGTADVTFMAGFYCSVDADTQARDACFAEYYEIDGVNENQDACPYNYRREGTLDSLYEFASTGSADSEGGRGRRVPVILAIFFGCLSAALFVAVIFLATSRATAPAGGSHVQV